MKRRRATQSAGRAENSRTHLLVLVNSRAPAEMSARSEGYETASVQLAATPLQELVKYSEQHWSRVTVVLPGWPHLRLFALPARLLGETSDLVIRMTQDSAASVQPSLGQLATRGMSIDWTSSPDGTLAFQVHADKAFAVFEIVREVLGADRGPLHLPLRVGVTQRSLEPYVVGNPHARYVGIDDVLVSAGNDLSTVDLALGRAHVPSETGLAADRPDVRPVVRVLVQVDTDQDEHGLVSVDPALALPPVDTWVVNPGGFTGHKRKAVLTAIAPDEGTTGTLIVDDKARVVVRVLERAPLLRQQLAQLRPFNCVRITPAAFGSAVENARLVSQLAAAGVPIIAPSMPPAVNHLLGPELVAAISEVTPDVVDDPLLREVASVRLRRAALRNHAPGVRARKIAALAGLPVPPLPTVSVVLVTRRPHFLESALAQVARQTWGELELVLGLHGDEFDDAEVEKAIADFPRPVTIVRAPASESFGQVLNLATAAAQGEYLTKWDDDDYYGADHVWDLLLAADYSCATVVGKGSEFIQLDDLGQTVGGRNPVNERRVRFVAGGTMLLRRQTLVDLGGWRPVPFAVDQALLRMVLDAGGTIYRTHGLEYVLRRHGQGHTWHAETEYFLERQTRQWPISSWRQELVLTSDLSVRQADEPAEEDLESEHA